MNTFSETCYLSLRRRVRLRLLELADELAVAVAHVAPTLLHCSPHIDTIHDEYQDFFSPFSPRSKLVKQLTFVVRLPKLGYLGRRKLRSGLPNRGDDLVELRVCLVQELFAVLKSIPPVILLVVSGLSNDAVAVEMSRDRGGQEGQRRVKISSIAKHTTLNMDPLTHTRPSDSVMM